MQPVFASLDAGGMRFTRSRPEMLTAFKGGGSPFLSKRKPAFKGS